MGGGDRRRRTSSSSNDVKVRLRVTGSTEARRAGSSAWGTGVRSDSWGVKRDRRAGSRYREQRGQDCTGKLHAVAAALALTKPHRREKMPCTQLRPSHPNLFFFTSSTYCMCLPLQSYRGLPVVPFPPAAQQSPSPSPLFFTCHASSPAPLQLRLDSRLLFDAPHANACPDACILRRRAATSRQLSDTS